MLWGMTSPIVSRIDAVEPYRVLGVPATASAADVRRAFRSLVRQLHPDVNPAARPGGELSSVVGAYRRLGRLGVLDRPAPAPAAVTRFAEPPQATGRFVDVYA
jgi:curved DNA-binding protein CbpA